MMEKEVAILKVIKRDIIYFIVAFIISITVVSFGIIQVLIKVDHNLKGALEKSKISQVEFALALYGKQLPDNKVKVYNAVGSKDAQMDYNKDNLSNYEEMWLFAAVPSLFLTFILFVPYLSIKKSMEIKKRKRLEVLLKGNYFEKYSLSGKEAKVKCIDGTIINNQIINKLLIFWSESNSFCFLNNDYHDDLGLYKIQFNDIICFSRYGDFYTSMNVKGGDSSFGGAALGYLIAGPAGAIIGSRNSIHSETTVHDKRETLVFIRENNEEKYLYLDPNFYDVLMHSIPSKEINIMAKKEKSHEDNINKVEKIRKLGELKEKGYIDESEFIKLKSELI